MHKFLASFLMMCMAWRALQKEEDAVLAAIAAAHKYVKEMHIKFRKHRPSKYFHHTIRFLAEICSRWIILSFFLYMLCPRESCLQVHEWEDTKSITTDTSLEKSTCVHRKLIILYYGTCTTLAGASVERVCACIQS